MRKIVKFGGTSVGSVESLRALGAIVVSSPPVACVVSALGGITDQLIDAARRAAQRDEGYAEVPAAIGERHRGIAKALVGEKPAAAYDALLDSSLRELSDVLRGVFLTRELSPRVLDFVMSFGERLSAPLVAAYLTSLGLDSDWTDSRALVVTDENFGSARIDRAATDKAIAEYFAANGSTFHVVTGFISATPKGETTTLGRGGSDYTAAIVGAALDADEIEIWTDVDGIMTADPRKVRKAFSLAQLSYEETMELAHFGAKVIHPPTIQPAMRKGIPISIRNTFNPSFLGTRIEKGTGDSTRQVKGIASLSDIALLRVQGTGLVGVTGIAGRLFGALARKKVNVVLITQASSEHSICCAIAPADAHVAERAVSEEFSLEIGAKLVDPPKIEKNLSIVAVVGERMKRTPGISGRLFQALGMNGVNVVAIAQGSSELNISVVVSRDDEAKALNAIHDSFFLSDTNTVRLFLIGYGLVGRTLIEQVQKARERLLRTAAIDLRLCGIANSKHMAFDEDGIPLENCKVFLEAGQPSSPAGFVDTIQKMNESNSIFVDCTASEAVANQYLTVLKSNLSIVTPNKVANSGSWASYEALHRTAAQHGIKFLYETNVGAGLPIINTLQDLLASGDTVVRIEAVLSGTISYIFNNFKGTRTFSSLVREAKAKGFTEPDPRTDLSALDAARKTLILARELGVKLELKDIAIQPLLPPECCDAHSVDEFLALLEKFDDRFETMKKSAESSGKLIRYVSVVEGGKASIEIREVDSRHPFASLDSSDNIVSYTTARYAERPLVVKGPGAGAEVTAAGVFADILRIANYLGR
jgi:bifunctional aspartokinase / homoserine dehydrogenase 1